MFLRLLARDRQIPAILYSVTLATGIWQSPSSEHNIVELFRWIKEAAVSTPELEALLEEAIAHVNAGDTEQGRDLLEQVLGQDPKNDRAWVWMSGCVEDPRQRQICLQQALNANPNNQAALDGLQVLEGELVQASEIPPSLLESRLSAIGMGDQVEAPASPPATHEAAPSLDPVAPTAPDEWAETELVEEPATDEAVEKPRRGRIILLVAVVLLLCVIVCALVGTQVVPVLLETVPSNLL
jgi:tetratricopeptide (TPR) repeat protein